MEPLLETIDLDIEESNELLFKVKIEGTEPSPAKVRLVCEVGDLAYMFYGHPTSDEGVVQFLLPVLRDKLKEGQYLSRVEVLIENRYFTPVSFNLNLKKTVSVVAESIRSVPRKVAPQVTVTAAPVVVAKKPVPVPAPTPVAKPLVIEEQKKAPPVQAKPAAATLKERFAAKPPAKKQEETVVEDVNAESEELLRELARGFTKRK